ncbi:MAG: T9SS type A sorting domain-containing protein, partial [Bacteroidetes bacterium]|jgi:endonuclease I|nr:T9SS type A sorting domain-containing protein [Bacteroidota bacterium]
MEYGEARDTLYKIVEARNDSVYGIYTEHAVYLPPNENPRQAIFRNGAADGINAEHTWPRSKGSRNNLGERDMHHLRPSKVSVNADRANFPFAQLRPSEVTTWYYRSEQQSFPPPDEPLYSKLGSGLFEPRDAVKGDIARGMMYFYTVYRAEALGADPDFFDLQRMDLCQWHLDDPVDEREWERSQTVARYQEDKANPFVLDCTLAHRLYCSDYEECEPTSSSIDPSITVDYSVFPSPARSHVTLLLEGAEFKDFVFEIISSQGQLMIGSQMRSHRRTLSIEDWPTGVYFVRFKVQNASVHIPVKRFIVY